MLVRVGAGHTGRRGDVAGGHFALTVLAQVHDDRFVIFAGEHDSLDVEQDLGHVLLDAGQSGELVQGTGDTHRRHSGTRDGAQERTAQRVAKRIAESGLERLDREAGALGVEGFLGKCRTLCDKHCGILSAPNRWCTHRPKRVGWMVGVLRRDGASGDERRCVLAG